MTTPGPRPMPTALKLLRGNPQKMRLDKTEPQPTVLPPVSGDKTIGDGLRICPWGQGVKDMGPAIDALEVAVMERKLIHDSSPILNWNMSNAVAVMDAQQQPEA